MCELAPCQAQCSCCRSDRSVLLSTMFCILIPLAAQSCSGALPVLRRERRRRLHCWGAGWRRAWAGAGAGEGRATWQMSAQQVGGRCVLDAVHYGVDLAVCLPRGTSRGGERRGVNCSSKSADLLKGSYVRVEEQQSWEISWLCSGGAVAAAEGHGHEQVPTDTGDRKCFANKSPHSSPSGGACPLRKFENLDGMRSNTYNTFNGTVLNNLVWQQLRPGGSASLGLTHRHHRDKGKDSLV